MDNSHRIDEEGCYGDVPGFIRSVCVAVTQDQKIIGDNFPFRATLLLRASQ